MKISVTKKEIKDLPDEKLKTYGRYVIEKLLGDKTASRIFGTCEEIAKRNKLIIEKSRKLRRQTHINTLVKELKFAKIKVNNIKRRLEKEVDGSSLL